MVTRNAVAAVVTESWLGPDVLDPEVAIEGFNIFRSDRAVRQRGGVLAYVREDLSALAMLQYSDGVVELLVVKIRDIDSLLVGVYRPPDTTAEEWAAALDVLHEAILLAQAHNDKYRNLIMCGDFNFPDVRWEDPALVGLATGQAGMLVKFMEQHFIDNVVTEPTRLNNILDLVMTNNVDMISHIEIEKNVKFSDHNTVISYLNLSLDNDVTTTEEVKSLYSTSIPLYDLTKADQEDWVRFAMVLDSMDLENGMIDLSLEEKVAHLSKSLEEAVAEVFSLRPPKGKGS
jgi:hypothetical protein